MVENSHTRPDRWRSNILVAILLLPLLSTACNREKGPGGQTVATVNGDAITTSDMQLEMANIPPDQRKAQQPLVLQTLIDRKLLAQYAKKEGIDRSPDYVLRKRRMDEVLLAERAAQQVTAGAAGPVTSIEINRYLESHPNIASNRRKLTMDQLTFPMPDAKVAKALLQAKTMDDVVAILQQNGIQMTRNQVTGDTATLSDELSAQLDALKPGEPLIILNRPNSTANVIVDSKPIPTDNSQAEEFARNRINAQRTEDAVQNRGMSLRREAKIDYADGYKPKATKKSGS